jgi:hypothetical protein
LAMTATFPLLPCGLPARTVLLACARYFIFNMRRRLHFTLPPRSCRPIALPSNWIYRQPLIGKTDGMPSGPRGSSTNYT